jgi:hypothetical protein
MVGMLITMVCMVVLFTILMTSLNKAVTGEGSQHEMTVRSFEDKLYLDSLFKSMLVFSNDNKGRFITPAAMSGSTSKDPSLNTTANLFSVMVMQNYAPCKQLISGNEYSGYVEEKRDYQFSALNPAQGVFWDPTFQADLAKLSNVSFAHVPLTGERLEKHWCNTLESSIALIGNRGPRNGDCASSRFACGRDKIWRGHMVYGDGHIDFIENTVVGKVFNQKHGVEQNDNIFSMETGPNGTDAIIAFTRAMKNDGPELQFD